MKVTKFTYKTEEWLLDELSFGQMNLLVGKNASGKSRTLSSLSHFILLLSQREEMLTDTMEASISVESTTDNIKYILATKDSIVMREELWWNGKQYLNRTKDSTSLTTTNNNTDSLSPPKNSLTMHVRRDTVLYPFFEMLIEWAENAYFINFGYINYNRSITGNNIHNITTGIRRAVQMDLGQLFKALSPIRKGNILANLKQIGFNVSSIKNHPVEGQISKLKLVEDEVGLLESRDLSQGMYRTLYILILIEYAIQNRKTDTLLIDDLCEGLDYDRSLKLGKIIFSVCEKNDVQLIVTSNDGFLMDVIPLQYWNVLTRKGKHVSAINYENAPKLFNDFKFTGLSNFDFFSSDYLSQKRQ